MHQQIRNTMRSTPLRNIFYLKHTHYYYYYQKECTSQYESVTTVCLLNCEWSLGLCFEVTITMRYGYVVVMLNVRQPVGFKIV